MVEKYDPIQGKSEAFQRGLLSCRGQVRSPSVALWVDAGKLPALGNDALLLSHWTKCWLRATQQGYIVSKIYCGTWMKNVVIGWEFKGVFVCSWLNEYEFSVGQSNMKKRQENKEARPSFSSLVTVLDRPPRSWFSLLHNKLHRCKTFSKSQCSKNAKTFPYRQKSKSLRWK